MPVNCIARQYDGFPSVLALSKSSAFGTRIGTFNRPRITALSNVHRQQVYMIASVFRSLVESKGLSAAMRQLNDDSPYRFSAVFAFDGDLLHNVCFIDKLNPAAGLCADQSIRDSYCVYVQRARERFAVEDARDDLRVTGHSKRDLFYCYYGVPLLGSDGELLGTACHFDERSIAVPAQVADALDSAAPFISEAAFPGRPVRLR